MVQVWCLCRENRGGRAGQRGALGWAELWEHLRNLNPVLQAGIPCPAGVGLYGSLGPGLCLGPAHGDTVGYGDMWDSLRWPLLEEPQLEPLATFTPWSKTFLGRGCLHGHRDQESKAVEQWGCPPLPVPPLLLSVLCSFPSLQTGHFFSFIPQWESWELEPTVLLAQSPVPCEKRLTGHAQVTSTPRMTSCVWGVKLSDVISHGFWREESR